jgi:hypothetical protein
MFDQKWIATQAWPSDEQAKRDVFFEEMHRISDAIARSSSARRSCTAT